MGLLAALAYHLFVVYRVTWRAIMHLVTTIIIITTHNNDNYYLWLLVFIFSGSTPKGTCIQLKAHRRSAVHVLVVQQIVYNDNINNDFLNVKITVIILSWTVVGWTKLSAVTWALQGKMCQTTTNIFFYIFSFSYCCQKHAANEDTMVDVWMNDIAFRKFYYYLITCTYTSIII